jgi:hypothetical protein
MKLQRTLFQTCATALVAVAFGSMTWSCSHGRKERSPGPTGPSSLEASSEPTVVYGATTSVVSWECLTAGRGGIFSSGASSCASAVLAAIHAGPAAASAPTAPSNVTSSVNGNTVLLTWLAAGAGDATSYLIEAGSFPGGSNLASFDTGNAATSLTAPGVAAGTYYVRVRARNAAGTSGASNEIVVAVGSAPSCATAPTPPSGLRSSVNGSAVTLTWNAPGGGCAPTSYVLEAGSSPGAINLANYATGSTATSFSGGGVGAGTYYVRVRAANAAGVSGVSNEIAVVIVGQRECSQRIGPFVTQTTAYQRLDEAKRRGYSVSGVFPCYEDNTRGYCFNVFFPC